MLLAVKIWFVYGVGLLVMVGIGVANITNQSFQSWWLPLFTVLLIGWVASALIAATVWVWRGFK